MFTVSSQLQEFTVPCQVKRKAKVLKTENSTDDIIYPLDKNDLSKTTNIIVIQHLNMFIK